MSVWRQFAATVRVMVWKIALRAPGIAEDVHLHPLRRRHPVLLPHVPADAPTQANRADAVCFVPTALVPLVAVATIATDQPANTTASAEEAHAIILH